MSKKKLAKTYVPLNKDSGKLRMLRALKSGAKITVWEKGSGDRFDLNNYTLSTQNPETDILVLHLQINDQQRDFPKNWNFVGLLYHVIFEGISYLGKILFEKQPKLETHANTTHYKIQIDPVIYAVERRTSKRVRLGVSDSFSLRIKLVDPPLIPEKALGNDNVVNLFNKEKVFSLESIWMEFVKMVNSVGKHANQKNEIFMNYPIIDLSETGVSIPLTQGEKDYYELQQNFVATSTLEFPRDTIDIPRIKFVYAREIDKNVDKLLWERIENFHVGYKGRIYHSGWSFDNDVWVKKQLEMKLKFYSHDVEDEFEKLVV